MAKTEVRNTLAQLRAKRGIGPSQLAAQVGVSRQTIYAIEAGTYVPNTSVSLKLARALDTSVEEIFQLQQEETPTADCVEVVVLGDADALAPGQPLRLCQVDSHLVAVAPEPGGWGLPSSDAVLVAPHAPAGRNPANATVRLVGEGRKTSPRVLVAGCDPSVSVLASAVQREGCEIVVAYENSSRSLELLREGLVHVAGSHLLDKATGDSGLTAMIKAFPRKSVVAFSYAVWREGLVVARGNPKKILGVSDLVRKDVEIANREAGAGCRLLLDNLLRAAGIPSAKVKGYNRIVHGQLPAARLVRSGEVDCCVCTEAGARSLGLDFVSLADKPYHLFVHRKHLDLHPVQVLLETLGKLSFRREVEASVGYDMHSAGERIV